MTHQTPPEHFKGKTVSAHLKDAREKGAAMMEEGHGADLPGSKANFANSSKDTASIFLILFSAAYALSFNPLLLLISFSFGYIIWKSGRSAIIGWNRLEKLHRIIEEERWEIEHHREQEKSELKEMYATKGFSGKLLDEVVEVLMADDNRLLQVMLVEELGLSLEVYEHPLHQAFGTFLGTLIAAGALVIAHYFWPSFGIPVIACLMLIIASNLTAKFEKRARLRSIVWNLSVALFASGGVYFLAKLLKP